jgi:hypothetical protein
MATADITTHIFDDGKYGVSFSSIPTEASAFEVIPAADHTTQSCYIHFVQLGCSCGSNVRLVDGSNGSSVLRLQCATGHPNSETWDFDGVPLALMGDTSEGIDISSSAAGDVAGFIKYSWGPTR